MRGTTWLRRAGNVAAVLVAVVAAVAVGTASPAEAAENGARSFYPADDTSEAYGKAGTTWTGPAAYGAGRVGVPGDRAFSLGGGGFLTVADETEGNFGTGAFTLRFSARFTGSGGPSEQVLSKRGTCGEGTFLDVRTRDGLVYAELQDADDTVEVLHPTDVYDGAYHQVTLTRSGSTLSVVVDGVAASDRSAGVVDLDTTAPLRFGQGPCVGDGTTQADVLLDDVSYGPGISPTVRPLIAGIAVDPGALLPPPVATGPEAVAVPRVSPDDPAPAQRAAATPDDSSVAVAGPSGPAAVADVPLPALTPQAEPGSAPASFARSASSDRGPALAGTSSPGAASAPGDDVPAPGEAPAGDDATAPEDPTVPTDRAADTPPTAGDARAGQAGSTTPTGPTTTATARTAVVAPLTDPWSGRAALDFAAALPAPDAVDGDLGSLLDSAVLALALLALLGVPARMLDRTARDNADRVAGAFARLRVRRVAGWSERLSLVEAVPVAALAAGVVLAFLQPTLGFDLSSVALALGLAAACVVVTAASTVSHRACPGRHPVVRRHLRLLPGFLLLALACVLVSRYVGLQPGLILGTLLTFTTASTLHGDTDGEAKTMSLASLATVGALAWVLREPLVGMAGGEATFLAQFAGAGLTAVTVAAIGTLAFAMIPIAFLDGAAVFAWSKPVWAALSGLGAFGFVHVLLRPTVGAEQFVGREPVLVVLLAAYLLAVTALGAWLRFRTPAREVTHS